MLFLQYCHLPPRKFSLSCPRDVLRNILLDIPWWGWGEEADNLDTCYLLVPFQTPPHSNSEQQLALPPFDRHRNRGSEKLTNLPQVTQLEIQDGDLGGQNRKYPFQLVCAAQGWLAFLLSQAVKVSRGLCSVARVLP